jgi:hypothetical protein
MLADDNLRTIGTNVGSISIEHNASIIRLRFTNLKVWFDLDHMYWSDTRKCLLRTSPNDRMHARNYSELEWLTLLSSCRL